MPSHPLPDPKTLAELRALNSHFVDNFVRNDVAAHDAILHPAFTYLSGSGRVVSRAQYLREWASGFDPEVLPYWDLRGEAIAVFGPVALIRAANKYVERGPSGESVGVAAYTDTYLREDGVWRCIQAQISPVARENWPGDETVIRVWQAGIETPRPQGLALT